MKKHSGWQVIVVDWDMGRYACIDRQADDEDWDRDVSAEKEKGRDVHCFHHDIEDTSGLQHWAKQHGLTQTDISAIMSVPAT